MASFETIEVTTEQVACNGGGGALGHPKVYLHVKHEQGDQVTCPYCSRTYVLNSHSHAA